MTTYRFCDDDGRKMDFLAGLLGTTEKREVEEHLSSCPACQSDLAELKLLSGELAQLTAPSCPPELAEAAIETLLCCDQLGRKIRKEQILILGALGSIALTVLLLMAGGIIPGLAAGGHGSEIDPDSGILRFALVMLLLLGLPAGLDNLGFLLIRRRLMAT